MQNTVPTSGKAIRLGEKWSLVLGGLVLVLWAAVALDRVWNEWGEDLAALYMAGRMIHIGQPELVYLVTPESFVNVVPDAWKPEMMALGLDGQIAFPYLYPPLWAVLAAPVTGWLSPLAFTNAVAAIQVGLLCFGTWISWRLVNRAAKIPFWAWSGLSVVLLQTGFVPAFALELMQPQITVTILCLLAIERLAYGRDATAGALLAVATAIKLTPAILVLMFVMERRWRALGVFAMVAAALVSLGLVLAPPGLHGAFLDSLEQVRGRTLLACSNFSMNSALFALWHAMGWVPPLPGDANYIAVDLPASAGLLSKALLGLALFAAWRAGRTLTEAWRLPYALFQLTLFGALFGPFAWGHYFLVQVFLAPTVLALGSLASRIAAGVSLTAAGSVAVVAALNRWPDAGLSCASAAALALLMLGVLVALVAAQADHDRSRPLRPKDAWL